LTGVNQANKLQQQSIVARLLLKEVTTKSKKGTVRPWPQTESGQNFGTKIKRKKRQRFCSTYMEEERSVCSEDVVAQVLAEFLFQKRGKWVFLVSGDMW